MYAFVLTLLVSSAAPIYPWLTNTNAATLHERIKSPEGTVRVPVTAGSYAQFLRHLPVRPAGSPVTTYDGRRVAMKPAAVIDLDVGARNLQQCADSIIRLYAEYQRSAHATDPVAFHFTNGTRATWADYRSGQRAQVSGSTVRFRKTAAPDDSYESFRRYLSSVFVYAGTASLARYSTRANGPVAPGDFFVLGGHPGHAVLVLDVARSANGETHLLIGQGYMPAQSFHVVAGPSGPWHKYDGALKVETWPVAFTDANRRRVPR